MSTLVARSVPNSCSHSYPILKYQRPKPFAYLAYGLKIQSDLPLPEYIPAQAGGDVTIRLSSNRTPDEWVSSETEQSFAIKLDRNEVAVYAKDIGVFLIQSGHTIVVIPALNVSQQQLRNVLLGKVMAILLHQRGLLVLQATAVNIAGRAVLFLSNSGKGKSAVATALHAQGWDVLADQVLAVALNQDKTILSMGLSEVNSTQDVADAQGNNNTAPLTLPPQKKGKTLGHKFCQMSLPLGCLYILTLGTKPSIKPLPSHEAVIKLIHHSGLAASLRARGTRQLLQCAALVKTCPIYGLHRPHDLELLPKLARMVESHVKQMLKV